MLQGDGTNSRRYVYAGDVADAFDTILHKGTIGQTYNVDSTDEISNSEICQKLMKLFKLPCQTQEDMNQWVEYGQDRPFNDKRYEMDGSKLHALGWKQKTTFEKGLEMTVEWYKRYGETWWGDISSALTPFPVIEGNALVTEEHHQLASLVLKTLTAQMEAKNMASKPSRRSRSPLPKRMLRRGVSRLMLWCQ